MARISELHFSNSPAGKADAPPFIEIALEKDEPASDFVMSFYHADGTVAVSVPLDDARVQLASDAQTDETICVLSAGLLPILQSPPEGDPRKTQQGFALCRKSTGSIEIFLDIGSGDTALVARDGPAKGQQAVNVPLLWVPPTPPTSYQWPAQGAARMNTHPVTPRDQGIACFTAGTRILTVTGPRAVEDLSVGELVETADEGPRALRWIGRRRVRGLTSMAPIRFGPVFLGSNRELILSPQHRLLVTGWQAEHAFGESEVLAPAKSFLHFDGVSRMPCPWVEYYHLLFDRHQIIYAEGVPCESLLLHDLARKQVGHRESAAETLTLFPELRRPARAWEPARRILSETEASALQHLVVS